MTEEEKKLEEEKKKKQEELDASAGTKKPETDGDQQPGPVPYERFKEVNEKAKGYEARLAELEKTNSDRELEEEKARQARLKEQEKFQELATEWETKATDLKPKFDASEAELAKVNEILGKYAEAQMESVPELYRDIVAKMPLVERLEWLTENIEKLGKTPPKGVPATPKGTGTGELTDEERRNRSARTF